MQPKYIPLSAFQHSTRFDIDPGKVRVVESGKPGCMEVQLTNYNDAERRTVPGGVGLVIQGNVESINNDDDIRGRYALVAGINEVFTVEGYFDRTVTLRPLGIGLGVRWQRYKENASSKSRKSRVRKKRQARADRFFSDSLRSINQLTGTLAGEPSVFFVREQTRSWTGDTSITRVSFTQAMLFICALIARLTQQGWRCRKGQCDRSNLQVAPDAETAWLCNHHGPEKRVSLEYGVPTRPDPEDERYRKYAGGDKRCTADDIAEMADTWCHFNGFSAETCGRCLLLANVHAGGPGWFCPKCGWFNVQSWSCHQIPHEHPDYGPPRAVIHEGVRKSKRLQEYFRRTDEILSASRAAGKKGHAGLSIVITDGDDNKEGLAVEKLSMNPDKAHLPKLDDESPSRVVRTARSKRVPAGFVIDVSDGGKDAAGTADQSLLTSPDVVYVSTLDDETPASGEPDKSHDARFAVAGAIVHAILAQERPGFQPEIASSDSLPKPASDRLHD